MDTKTDNTPRVKAGSHVKIVLGDNSEHLYTIGHTSEANPSNGVISDECPIGKALLGAKAGDVISYRVGERDFTVRVLEVS